MDQMIKDIVITTIILGAIGFLFWCQQANADDNLRAVPISEGQKAPFSGMLMTIDLATNLGNKIERCEALSQLELLYQEKRCTLNTKKLHELHDLREKALSSKLDLAMKRVKELEKVKKPFWEEPAIVASVGVAAGLAIGFGAVWAAAQLSP